jgi:hypothetical protein
MNHEPPHAPNTGADAGADSAWLQAHSPEVDGIVANAMTATAVAPTPSRRERRHHERLARAQAKALMPRRTSTRSVSGTGSSSSTMRMLLWGLLALIALGAGAVATGVIELGPPSTGPTDTAGGTGSTSDAWSYYHDREYEAGVDGAKWTTDTTRSSDPDESVLGDTTRWEYDGPYRYGPYGSDGMRRRAAGRETADPLYSQPDALQDVFTQYGGNLDPSGGQPVGNAPSRSTSPYYDPYGGYSNPYSNRIRMAYGEGIGRGASYAP